MIENKFEVDNITYISHEGSTLYLAVETKTDEKMFMDALMDAGLYVHHRGDNDMFGIVIAYIDSVEVSANTNFIDMVTARDGDTKYAFIREWVR